MDDLAKDACPAWADRMIRQIQDLEVKLGNLRDPQETWAGGDLTDLDRRAFSDPDSDLNAAEETVEALFTTVAKGLLAEGHDPVIIAEFINARVGRGGRLPYCDAREVREALGDQRH